MIGVPAQPLAVGIIVKVTNTGERVGLTRVPLILPEPLAGIPVTVAILFLLQLYVVPLTAPDSTIVVIGLPVHTVCEAGVATAVGIGLTTTVAVIDGPVQVTPPLVKLGVMVKVTVTGAVVVLVSEPPILFPVPLAAIPVTVALLSRVQANVVPGTLLVNTIVVMALPEHIACDTGVAMALGIGLTSTVAVIGVPVQPLADGVMVKVTSSGAVEVIDSNSVPLIGLPVPLAGMPVTCTRLSLVHVYVVPGILLVSTIGVIGEPEQIVWLTGEAKASGEGFTNTVAVVVGPTQPLAVGVIVKVTVTGTKVVLVSMPLMLPDPLAAIPVTVAVLSLVQV